MTSPNSLESKIFQIGNVSGIANDWHSQSECPCELFVQFKEDCSIFQLGMLDSRKLNGV